MLRNALCATLSLLITPEFQASESVHPDWLKIWENYKVMENNPNYSDQFLNCGVEYNQRHMLSE